MASPRTILVNASSRAPLAFAGSAAVGTITPFVQGEEEAVVLKFYELDDFGRPVSMDTSEVLQVQLALVGGAGKPTGTIGGPSLLLYSSDWTAVGTEWQGILSYNTQPMADFIAANATAATTLEVTMSFVDGTSTKALQWPVTLNASVIEGTVTAIPGIPEFFAMSGTPGGTIPDGSLWANTASGVLSVYAGGQWNVTGGSVAATPPDGAYEFTTDGSGVWLRLWDDGTNTYRKIWLTNGALRVQ